MDLYCTTLITLIRNKHILTCLDVDLWINLFAVAYMMQVNISNYQCWTKNIWLLWTSRSHVYCVINTCQILSLHYHQMALRPQYPQEMKILHNTIHGKYKDCREAVTRYRVLSEANSTALVECQPETGRCSSEHSCIVLGNFSWVISKSAWIQSSCQLGNGTSASTQSLPNCFYSPVS